MTTVREARNDTSGLAGVIFWGAAALSAVFALLLLFANAAEKVPLVSRFFHLLLLTDENNVSVWWSGVLLGVSAIHAFDGWVLQREVEPRVARGWLGLCALFLALSVDEVGSLHERASTLLSLPTWPALIPGAAVLGLLLLYAVVAFLRSETHRRKVPPILLAMACFGSVALQELVENRGLWGGSVRAFVEEGTELAGMLILLRVTMSNTRGLGAESNAAPTFALVGLGGRRASLYLLPIVAATAVLTASLPDQYRGHPADWLASMLFLAAALTVSAPWVRTGEVLGARRWLLVASCWLGSALSVAARPHWQLPLGAGSDVNSRLLVMAVLASGVVLLWAARAPRRIGHAVALGFVALVTMLASSSPSLLALYFLTSVIALLVYDAQVSGSPGPSGAEELEERP